MFSRKVNKNSLICRLQMSSPKFGKLKVQRSQCREIVCCVCAKKVKQNNKSIKKVSDKLAGLVRKFVFDGYTIQDPWYPTAICDSCRLTLSALEKVNFFCLFVGFPCTIKVCPSDTLIFLNSQCHSYTSFVKVHIFLIPKDKKAGVGPCQAQTKLRPYRFCIQKQA